MNPVIETRELTRRFGSATAASATAPKTRSSPTG